MIDIPAQDRFIIALADGMGGHAGGEVASSDVLHNLHYFIHDLPSGLHASDINEHLYEWLQSMNNIVDSKGHSDPAFKDMGTTLVALLYYGGEFYWMNCGDSRLYQLSGDSITQLTTDHSLSELIGEAHHSSIITNCIGGGCKTSYIDIVCFTQNIQPGDTLMLCSDGLTDMVNDKRLRELMLKGSNATQLCEAALAEGGHDNVSVVVIKVFD